VASYQVVDGDTWDSIAQAFDTPTSWLMMNNGQDPDGDPPPSDPDVGSVINIPDPPPSCSVAPGNTNSVDLGSGGMDTVRIRLHDDTPAPMQNVRYSARFGGQNMNAVSEDGWVTISFPSGICATVDLRWGAPDDDSDHPYQTVLVTDCTAGCSDDQAMAMLENLGYLATANRLNAVTCFQRDYGLSEWGLADDGTVPTATMGALKSIFTGEYDASQPPPGGDS
jgi:hypothetical protein